MRRLLLGVSLAIAADLLVLVLCVGNGYLETHSAAPTGLQPEAGEMLR